MIKKKGKEKEKEKIRIPTYGIIIIIIRNPTIESRDETAQKTFKRNILSIYISNTKKMTETRTRKNIHVVSLRLYVCFY